MLRRKLLNNLPDETENKKLKTNDFANQVIEDQIELSTSLSNIDFRQMPIQYVYNPLDYAIDAYRNYLQTYCINPIKLLFVGMNPGPFGMCQTGVPFGDIEYVRDWLKLNGTVHKPSNECSERPILGFDFKRKEQSGNRFWGFIKSICLTPDNFFNNAFVYNYCPLAFMKVNGTNVTPPSLKIEKRKQLEEKCDVSYGKLIEILKPEVIIAIGDYVEKRTKQVLNVLQLENKPKILRLPHPSPIVPNNHNWHEKAATFFDENQLMKFFPTQQ